MGEKDITEKTLEAYNDVFADIVNVLLFGGKRLIKETDLSDAQMLSQYKAADSLHLQERDVAKFWNKGRILISFFGLENQTEVDRDMPLRVISYDGAAYRKQLGNKQIYPVVTLVLYFGTEHRWNAPVTLKERLSIPAELEKYVSDYAMNLFELSFLPEKVNKMFHSDFGLVVEYLRAIRLKRRYMGSGQQMQHISELLELFRALSRNKVFVDVEPALNRIKAKKGGVNMFDLAEFYRQDGIKEGLTKGIFDTARNMLSKHLDSTLIAECTGLSLEQVQSLASSALKD